MHISLKYTEGIQELNFTKISKKCKFCRSSVSKTCFINFICYFSVKVYPALLQKWHAIIVFFNKDGRHSKSVLYGFPYS